MSTTPDEFFANVAKEGDTDPFAALEKETPSESQPEKEPKEAEPVVGDPSNTPNKEDNVPFHEHPRWKQREQELEELREQTVRQDQEISELKSRRSEPSDTEVPEWFRELYGDNAVAWEKYNEHHASEREAIKQEAVAEIERKAEAEVAETQKWNSWVENEIGKLKGEGKEFDRNELINVMLTYRPTDPNNNFDFEAGYKIYEALKAKPATDPAKSHARKQLADSTATTSGEPKAKSYQTSATLRNLKWGSIE